MGKKVYGLNEGKDIKANDGLQRRKGWKGTIPEGYQVDKGRNKWQISLWIWYSWGISRFTRTELGK